MTCKRQKLKSGNPLSDWFFYRMVQILNRAGTDVYLVKSFRRIFGKEWTRFTGILEPGGSSHGHEIFINNGQLRFERAATRPRDRQAIVLLHEMLHILMPKCREADIFTLERILWASLSHDQKRFLKHYLPKRPVKNP